ncbi:MAG: hypothetical protein HY782_12225, partial [Chloroflexi bacterium]|nr:hypothetical protein [Chloroflexota bacterium]
DGNTVLEEPRLCSKVPILGSLIDRLRDFWISAVERHYVVPILNQQSAFNAKISELMRLQSELYERESATRQQEVATLRQEIATLRTQNDVAARLLQMQSTDDAAIPYMLQMLRSDRKPGSTKPCNVSEE